jgi:hypothetical protein
VHLLLIGAPPVPAHPYNLDQLISEDGTVTIEQPILSVEEETINYFLLSSSSSATTLLPGQDKPAPSAPMSGASWFVVSCGVRLSEVGLSEIRKPQVVRSIRIAGSTFQSLTLLVPTTSGSGCGGGAGSPASFPSSRRLTKCRYSPPYNNSRVTRIRSQRGQAKERAC